jgi:pyruvate/2-oxoglutarate/acetoin dehydrogenase E1 component
MSLFSEAVNQAMRKLAQHERTVFVGQSVAYDGAAIHTSLDGVPAEKRLEMPVIEDFQVGFCVGLALKGKIPICIFPRIDFMLLAANQIVNHLDKLPVFGWDAKVILRTTVGQKRPLDAGPQHTQNHTNAFRLMLRTTYVEQVRYASDVVRAYDDAMASKYSTLIVENPS